MKLFGKLLIAALVLAVLLPFTFLKGKDGKPLMSLSDIKAPKLALPEMPDALKHSNKEQTPTAGGKDIIYKWRDSKGELHFSSSPPADGTEYTAKGYDPNANLIQAVEVKTEPVEKPQQQSDNNDSKPQKPFEIGNPYSPKKVEKLINDAQNIQKLLNDRQKKQQALID